MLVDSHCHLDCLDLANHEGDADKAITAAMKNGVSHFLCVCIDLEHFQDVLSFAERYDNIDASVGVHPNSFDGEQPIADNLVKYANNPKVIAIGETGLDYFRTEKELQKRQQENFMAHITAAKQTNKPLIIHMRDAADDTLSMMKNEQANTAGGVMHCFTETWEVAKRALDLGFYISISGIVTFKNAAQIQEVATKVPGERLLIETDAPYLAPVPMRGKPNEPAYLHHTARFIANLRNMAYEDLVELTRHNFFTLFHKNPY